MRKETNIFFSGPDIYKNMQQYIIPRHLKRRNWNLDLNPFITALIMIKTYWICSSNSASQPQFPISILPDHLDHSQMFRANRDSNSVKLSYLEHPVRARFIRVHIEAWHNNPALRMEVLGCQGYPQMVYFDHWWMLITAKVWTIYVCQMCRCRQLKGSVTI